MEYKSYFFKKNTIKSQPKDFLEGMEKNIYKKTINEMMLLQKYGIDTNYVSIKKFQNNIWKIRVKNPSNNVRLFFYVIDNNIYYIYGFYKKLKKHQRVKKSQSII